MFYSFAPETNKLSTFWSCTPKKNESPKLARWFSGFSVFGNFTTTTLTPLSLNICIFTSPSFTVLARSMSLTDDVFGHKFSMLFGHGHLMFVHAVWRSDLTMSFFDRCHPKNLQTHDFSGVLGTRPFCKQSVAKMTHSTMDSDYKDLIMSGNRTLIILIILIKLFFWVLSKKVGKQPFSTQKCLFSLSSERNYIIII